MIYVYPRGGALPPARAPRPTQGPQVLPVYEKNPRILPSILNSLVSTLDPRCKATCKREVKLPWREAASPNHHDDSGFGPVGSR